MDFAAHIAAADRAAQKHLGGLVVRYAPSGVADEAFVDVSAVFDAAYRLVDAGTQQVSSTTPAVFLRLSDLARDDGTLFDPEAEAGEARVNVRDTSYRVREVRPDGLGAVVLLLMRPEPA